MNSRSLIFALSMMVLPWTVHAQDHCPKGNLLAKKKVTQKVGVKYAYRLTNHASSAEGASWNGPQSAIFSQKNAFVTYDLGQVTSLSALYLQADNNDTYVVSVSDDGKRYDDVWTVPIHPQPGLRTRSMVNLAGQARYIRLRPGTKGDGSFSVTEFQAYCTLPAVWPPAVSTPKAAAKSSPWSREEKLSIAKITLLSFGFLVFVLLLVHRRRPEYSTLKYLVIAGTLLIGYGVVYAVGWAPMKAPQDPKPGMTDLLLAAAAILWMGWSLWVHITVIWMRVFMGLLYVGAIIFDQVRHSDSDAGIPWTATNLAWLGFTLTLIWAGWALYTALARKQATVWFQYGPLLTIIFASGIAFSQFGMFHGTTSGAKALHDWDAFHYYIGGKYYRENGYDLIYQCANAADVEDGLKHTFSSGTKRDKIRLTRDLRNNKLEPADRAITEDKIKECHTAFGVADDPARWLAFKQDMRLFRKKMGQPRWQRMFKDHGSNATPVWNVIGYPITNLGWEDIVPPEGMENSPANFKRLRSEESKALRQAKTQDERAAIKKRFKDQRTEIQSLYAQDRLDFIQRMSWYALVDPVLYGLGFLLIWWAFGIYGCAFAILMWCGGYPWVYSWTGGGFGRVPWWFMTVAGTCFLRKGWSAFGGASITWAMLLRVFPGAIIAGVSLKIAHQVLAHKRLLKSHYRLIMGCTVSLVTLVVLSMGIGGGPSIYKEFLDNSFKHKETRLTNEMGLGTVVSFSGKGLNPTQWKNDSPDVACKTKCPLCVEMTLKDETGCAESETPTRMVLRGTREELVGCLDTTQFEALTGASGDDPEVSYTLPLIDPAQGWNPMREGDPKTGKQVVREVAFSNILSVSNALILVGELRTKDLRSESLKIALWDNAIYPPVNPKKRVWTKVFEPQTQAERNGKAKPKWKHVSVRQTDIQHLNLDPFMKWKAYRTRNIDDQWIEKTCLLGLFLAMLWYAGRRISDWEITALSAIMIVGIFDLTCYYYSFMVLLALVALRRFTYMLITYFMVVAGQAVHHAKICFEVDYVWESRIFVTAQFLILLGICIEVFLSDRKRPIGPPLTQGLAAVNPVCWDGAPPMEDTHEPSDEARFSVKKSTPAGETTSAGVESE